MKVIAAALLVATVALPVTAVLVPADAAWANPSKASKANSAKLKAAKKKFKRDKKTADKVTARGNKALGKVRGPYNKAVAKAEKTKTARDASRGRLNDLRSRLDRARQTNGDAAPATVELQQQYNAAEAAHLSGPRAADIQAQAQVAALRLPVQNAEGQVAQGKQLLKRANAELRAARAYNDGAARMAKAQKSLADRPLNAKTSDFRQVAARFAARPARGQQYGPAPQLPANTRPIYDTVPPMPIYGPGPAAAANAANGTYASPSDPLIQ